MPSDLISFKNKFHTYHSSKSLFLDSFPFSAVGSSGEGVGASPATSAFSPVLSTMTSFLGYGFLKNRMIPVRSNSFLYSSKDMIHLADFSLMELTWGPSLVNPTSFQMGLSFPAKLFSMILEISLVLSGLSHTSTSSGDNMTGMRWWTAASSGVASLVSIITSS